MHQGDYLGVIAERFEGDFGAYKQIAHDNHIKNPDVIRPGWTLTLPADAVDLGSMPHASGAVMSGSTDTDGERRRSAAPGTRYRRHRWAGADQGRAAFHREALGAPGRARVATHRAAGHHADPDDHDPGSRTRHTATPTPHRRTPNSADRGAAADARGLARPGRRRHTSHTHATPHSPAHTQKPVDQKAPVPPAPSSSAFFSDVWRRPAPSPRSSR